MWPAGAEARNLCPRNAALKAALPHPCVAPSIVYDIAHVQYAETRQCCLPGPHFRAGWRGKVFRTNLRLHRKGGGPM